jgi:hypothetical protein
MPYIQTDQPQEVSQWRLTIPPLGAGKEKEKEMEMLIHLLAGFDDPNAQNSVAPSQDPHGYNIAAMHDL